MNRNNLNYGDATQGGAVPVNVDGDRPARLDNILTQMEEYRDERDADEDTGTAPDEAAPNRNYDRPVESESINIIKKITIEQLQYGYIVKVGCHTFAIETHKRLSKVLAEYLADPSGTENKWFSNELDLKRNPNT